MITTCTVIVDNDISCLQYLFQSLAKKMSIISEILVADFDLTGKAQDREFTVDGVPARQFRLTYPVTECYSHAIGMHKCIDRAKNDYIMPIDPDVIIFKNRFDEFLLQLHQAHDLSIIGVEHPKQTTMQAFLAFPTGILALLRKSQLPGPDFLAGELKYRKSVIPHENDPHDEYPVQHENLYLIQTPIPSQVHLFPNPTGNYDAGCNLFLWAKRWLSFKKKNGGPTVYTTENTNNFDLQDNFGKQNLLFHCGQHANRINILKQQFAEATR